METWQAAILGLIQGLGEFLPISSSAHLILAPWLFNWKDPGLDFDVALHGGTLVAVMVYFRRDLVKLLRAFFRSLPPATRNLLDPEQKMAWLLAAATVPGAIAGLLLEKKAETAFRYPGYVALMLALFGLVLGAADRWGRRQRDMDAIGWRDAPLIGCSQALAVVPGVSRSGSTIAAGLGLGLTRMAAARFSFLLSMPIILGATVHKLRHFNHDVTASALAVGVLVSAVTGFLAIHYLLRYLASHNFRGFVWYRLGLAAFVLAMLAARGWQG